MSEKEKAVYLKLQLVASEDGGAAAAPQQCCGENANPEEPKFINPTEAARVVDVYAYDKNESNAALVRVIGQATKDPLCGYPNRIKCKCYPTDPGPISPPSPCATIPNPNPPPVTQIDQDDGFFMFKGIGGTSCTGTPATRYLVIWAEWDNCNGETLKRLQTTCAFTLNCIF